MSAEPEVRLARRIGWLKTIAVAGVAAIGQLVQVLRADADTNRRVAIEGDRLATIEAKIDAQGYELRHLSERITVLEAKK